MISRRLSGAILCQVLSATTVYANVSSEGPGYTSGFTSNKIYSFNLQSGATSTVTTIPAIQPVDLALLNRNTAYVLGHADGNIYAVNLKNDSFTRITPTPLPISEDLFAIAVANDNMAYVVGYNNNTIYSVNLKTGAFSPLVSIPGIPGLTDIVIASNTTAYTVGNNNGEIYLVNLQTGATSVVATIHGSPLLERIALANSTTAYVIGNNGATVRVVDLQTGVSSLVTTIPGFGTTLTGIAVSDTTAYVADFNTGHIYAINLLTGSHSILTTVPVAGLFSMALFLQMPTTGLHGNNEKLAKYLNKNAPIDVVRSFALLDNGRGSALESTAPTRNAFLTYASQNAFLAASQTLSDHSRQNRFHFPAARSGAIAASEIPADQLFASSDDALPNCVQMEPCCKRPSYTIWVTPFAEYAREKSQQQTPGFDIGLGGALAAFEYNGQDANVVGLGAAYAYSHVHEDNDAGKANLNQGFLTAYGTLNAGKWYFDVGLWGGYYHSNNQRKIVFPGVESTAKSQTHGWQAAPHLEVGYDGFWKNNCTLESFGTEPFIMAEWVANWEHGFKEHGAGNLNMGQKGRFCSLFRGETGLRFYEIIEFNAGKLVFREKVSYAYQKTHHTGRLSAFLVGSPGSFTVETLGSAQNLGVAEFSMLYAPRNMRAPYVDIRFQGEFGSKFHSYQGMLEVGKSF